VGKTTFIRNLVGQDFPGQRIGPEPTTDKFVAISHGRSDKVRSPFSLPSSLFFSKSPFSTFVVEFNPKRKSDIRDAWTKTKNATTRYKNLTCAPVVPLTAGDPWQRFGGGPRLPLPIALQIRRRFPQQIRGQDPEF